MAMNLERPGVGFTAEERNKQVRNIEKIEQEFSSMATSKQEALSYVAGEAYAQVLDSARINWQSPVATEADLSTTYPDATAGFAVMARDTGIVHRFDGTSWGEIQQIDAGPVNELDTRLTTQLAEKVSKEDLMFSGDFEYNGIWLPARFPVSKIPYKIIRQTDNRISHNFNDKSLITGIDIFLDSSSGNDSNSGLLEGSPVRSFNKAVEVANAQTSAVVINVLNEKVNRLFYLSGAITLNNHTVIQSKNAKNESLVGSFEGSLSWSADGTAYKANRSAVTYLFDAGHRDQYGLPELYKKVASVAAVQAEKGTWYTDGTAIWVRRLDDTAPNSDILALLETSAPRISVFGKRLVFKNIKFFNTYTAGTPWNAMEVTGDRGTDLYNINTAFCAGGRNGLATKFVGRVFSFNSIASHNGSDGFNYHASQNAENPYFAFEWHCKAYNNGLVQYDGAGKNNATTAHDGIAILRVGCIGFDCDGPILADVNGCISVNYECVMFNSKRSLFDTKAGFYFDNALANTPGVAYLFGCQGGGVDTYSISSDKIIEIYVKNFRGKNVLPEQNLIAYA